uniref:hypothetical protein n=1 Tax=uncultured Erythrobacter sp. TaxID=263913 RepID=UPI00260FE64C|nr:hypothetical protein [uncultured Erythrobacter sp.]
MKSQFIAVFTALAVCFASLGLIVSDEACADSWAEPTTKQTLSENGLYRFTVEPTPMESVLAYFKDELKAEEEGRAVERPAPLGLLERKNADGEWEPVWAGPLANDIAPVEVQVSNDGRHIVTLDNWHSVGRGENVVVIYGPAGNLVRTMALTEFLPKEYFGALSHSVSSTSWRKDVGFDAELSVLLIEVLVPGSDPYSDDAETVSFEITLSDGKVVFPPRKEWEQAQCAADTVNQDRERAGQEELAFLRQPLGAPEGCDMRGWHNYLKEAHLRLDPDWGDGAWTSSTVLFGPDHPRHAESVGWLRARLIRKTDYSRDESFVSPCEPEALVAAIAEIAEDVEPGSLSKASFYIAAPEAQYAQIAAHLEPTGAQLIWLDPEATIPQRPERLKQIEEWAATPPWYLQ